MATRSVQTDLVVNGTVNATTVQQGGASVAAKAPIVNVVSSTGSTETISWTTEAHELTMNVACTFSFSDFPASGRLGMITVLIKGAFTPTLPGSIDWNMATPPSYATPSLYVFCTFDGGTTVFGSQIGSGFA